MPKRLTEFPSQPGALAYAVLRAYNFAGDECPKRQAVCFVVDIETVNRKIVASDVCWTLREARHQARKLANKHHLTLVR